MLAVIIICLMAGLMVSLLTYVLFLREEIKYYRVWMQTYEELLVSIADQSDRQPSTSEEPCDCPAHRQVTPPSTSGEPPAN
jgi:hypothetical protein